MFEKSILSVLESGLLNTNLERKDWFHHPGSTRLLSDYELSDYFEMSDCELDCNVSVNYVNGS